MFSIYNIFPLLSSILFFFFGFWIFVRNRKDVLGLIFSFFCVLTFWWQFSWFILFSIEDIALASILVKIGYIGIILLPVVIYHFALLHLNKLVSFDKYFLYFLYFSTFLFEFFLLFSDFFVSGFYSYDWGFYPKVGFLHPIYLIFVIIMLLRLILLFWSINNFDFSTKHKEQSKYVFIAIIFYSCASLDFIANYGVDFYPIGFLFIILFLAFIGYSIVAHHLMDIKLALRKSFVMIASLFSIFSIFLVVKMLINKYIPDVFYTYTIADIIVLFIAISYYPKIRDYFFKIANKYFFTTLYNSGELNSRINDLIYSNIEFDEIYKKIDKALKDAFHMKSFGVLHYNKKTERYKIRYNSNISLGRKKNFEIDNFFINRNVPTILNHIKIKLDKNQKKSINELKKYKIEVITPLQAEKEIIGMLLLGKKETGEIYNADDLDVLRVIANQIVLSTESMRFYEEAKNYKSILKRRVKEKREEIEDSNKYLRELDKTKSEFISIVSHQLRTPLTVIKGYASMILEGTFGKVKEDKKFALNKVLGSSERLVQMVENLLYLSRIESKKLSFNLDECDFELLVKNTVNRYKNIINKDKIELIYKKSKKKIGIVNIDEEKIRLVIINLIENAIRNSEGKKILISTKTKNKKAIFHISNTGPTIPENKKNHIFDRFSGDKEEMGIGLYIVKKIIEGHKGKIVVRNKSNATGVEGWFEIGI